MRTRFLRALAAFAMLVGVSGGVSALTASAASAQYVGVSVVVHGGTPVEVFYNDTTQFIGVGATLLASGVDVGEFTEVSQTAPNYELAPDANIGEVFDEEVINVAIVRVALLGPLPVFEEPVTCQLDAQGDGECDS